MALTTAAGLLKERRSDTFGVPLICTGAVNTSVWYTSRFGDWGVATRSAALIVESSTMISFACLPGLRWLPGARSSPMLLLPLGLRCRFVALDPGTGQSS